MLRYEIKMTIVVDPDANFIEADLSDMPRVVNELVSSSMYDIDDIIVEECEVEEC